VATVSTPYCKPLSEAQEKRLRQAARDIEDSNKGGAVGNLKVLIASYKWVLLDKHQNFVEPVPPRSKPASAGDDYVEEPGTELNSQGSWCGYLDFAQVDEVDPDTGEKMTLQEFDWFNDHFPGPFKHSERDQMGDLDGLSTCHLKAAYQLLCRIEKESHIRKFDDSVSGKAAMWEGMVRHR